MNQELKNKIYTKVTREMRKRFVNYDELIIDLAILETINECEKAFRSNK